VISPAQPFLVVPRIPQDQPFIVRPNLTKRIAVIGGLAGGIVLFLGCLFGLSGLANSGAGLAMLGAWLLISAAFVALFGFQIWLLTSGGPVLAAGPAGLWIKTRPTRGQAIWLPWESIAGISRRRWSLEKMLAVHPRDPRAEQNLGMFTAIDSGIQKAFFGTGFTATLNFADKKEDEILQAVAYFSNGRVPLA
jgi:hypothetical protein